MEQKEPACDICGTSEKYVKLIVMRSAGKYEYRCFACAFEDILNSI